MVAMQNAMKIELLLTIEQQQQQQMLITIVIKDRPNGNAILIQTIPEMLYRCMYYVNTGGLGHYEVAVVWRLH